jgi:O-antigen/teichoic acid export membrane protein
MSQIHPSQDTQEVITLVDSFKRITKHSLIYGLGSIIGNVISFFLIPLYTRFLTTTDYGLLSSMTAVDSVLSIFFTLALQGAVLKFYFDYEGIKRKEMLGSIWLFQMLFALIISILLYLYSGNLATLVFKDLRMQPYLKLVVIRVFFAVGGLIPLAIYRAQERSLKYISLIFLTAILGVFFNIYFVVILRKGALGSLQGGVITAVILYILYLLFFYKATIFSFRLDIIYKALLFSLPLVPHLLGGWIMNLSDRLLLQRLSSARELGLYALGCNFALVLSIVVLAINNAWVPFFFSIAGKKEGQNTISKLLTYYFLFICLIALALSVFSKEITTIMAAANYRVAYRVIPAIALSYIFQGMYFMSVNCLFLKEKTRQLPFITLFCAVTNIVLNILWIPRYGMMGAAWATVIAYAMFYAITHHVSKRFYALYYEKARFLKIILAAVVVYIISMHIKTEQLLYSISVKTALMLGYFLLLYISRFFKQEEINNLKRLLGLSRA